METQQLIDALTSDLRPVKPVQPRSGLTLLLLAGFVAALAIVASFGVRADIMAGAPEPLVLIRSGLLLLLGLATGYAATNAARPAVGKSENGWLWALAAALLLPMVAILLFGYHIIAVEPFSASDMEFGNWPGCLIIGCGNGMLIAAAMTIWLKNGAPTNLNRVGWLVGLASGAFGTFSYALHCPSDSIYYIGLIYTIAIAICAGLGRLIIPHILRW